MADWKNNYFPDTLKRLSPELQEKIQTIANSPLLPVWPEQTRGIPNLCLRSSLFTIIQRGQRRAVKGEIIASVKGLDIRYTGWRLDQGDLDVLAHAFHLVSQKQKSPAGVYVQFTARGFLRSIGRKYGKSGRDWLKDSFRRLTASAVEIKLEISDAYRTESYTYMGSLIEEFYYSSSDHQYFLKANTDLAKLFEAGWTQLQWQQRLKLRTHLAKWLHGFYASHRTPFSLKVSTIKRLCGSDCGRLSDYRRKLRFALSELVDAGALVSWGIDKDDKVHVEKQESHNRNNNEGA